MVLKMKEYWVNLTVIPVVDSSRDGAVEEKLPVTKLMFVLD